MPGLSFIINRLHVLRPGVRLGAWVTGLALLWLAVAGVQALWGWPGRTVLLPVEVSQIRPEPKARGVWKAPIPKKYRGWLTDQRGVVLENGARIGRRSPSVSGVLKESGGIFSVHRGFMRWRQADGTDPRKNGRQVALQVPQPVPDRHFILGAVALLWAWTAKRGSSRPADGQSVVEGHAEPPPPARARPAWWTRGRSGFALALLVLTGTLAVGWSRIGPAMGFNDGVMMISGLPYSDASCWYEMSVSLAEGRGLASPFDGQRPWFSILIAMVHEWRGSLAVEHGLMVNAAALAVGAAGLVMLGLLTGCRITGVLAALVLVVSHTHLRAGGALMTEMAGLSLTVWSLVLILTSLGGNRPRWWAWGLGLGGVFQALGNLACPYTLAAMPLYGFLLWREGRRHAGRWWRGRAFLPGACFSLGLILVLGPWVMRQQRVHGLATISTQTADLLYGATFAEGPMKATQMKELYAHLDRVGHTPAERYRFSMKRFKETAGADPWGYAGKLGGRALAFFAYYNVLRPEPAAAVLLLILAVLWLRRRDADRWAWLLAGAAVAAAALTLLRLPVGATGPEGLLGLAVGAATVAWLTGSPAVRRAVEWLAATLAGCALINALTGNAIASRCWVFCDWALWFMVLAAVQGSHRQLAQAIAWLAARIRQRLNGQVLAAAPWRAPDGPVELSGPRRFVVVLTAVLLLVQGAGAASLWWRQRHPAVFAEAPRPEDLERVRQWAEREFPDVPALSGYPLQFQWVRLGEGACYLEANQEATLFSRAFRRLSWPRTLRLVRGTPPQPGEPATGAMVRLPGDARHLPEDRPGLLVSWLSVDPKANLGHDEEIYEGLAFFPARPDGSVEDNEAIRFPKIPIRPARPPEDRGDP